MKKHIAYLDKLVGYNDRLEISGDMGWTFCDMRDTFTEDVNELLAGSRDYCFGDAAELGDDVLDDDEGMFSIYAVLEADIELEDNEPLSTGEIIEGTAKTIEIHVCATKEQAGWIEDDKIFKDKTIRYRV